MIKIRKIGSKITLSLFLLLILFLYFSASRINAYEEYEFLQEWNFRGSEIHDSFSTFGYDGSMVIWIFDLGDSNEYLDPPVWDFTIKIEETSIIPQTHYSVSYDETNPRFEGESSFNVESKKLTMSIWGNFDNYEKAVLYVCIEVCCPNESWFSLSFTAIALIALYFVKRRRIGLSNT